jgi:uncharacterized protein (UPF0276 family)
LSAPAAHAPLACSGPFQRFVGVGLGIDVHNQQPDWREILARPERFPCDFFEVYTRGDVAGAHAVRAAAGGLPLLYHDDALDPILPGGVAPGALEAAVENLAAVGAPWCVSELATRRLGERYLDFFQPILLTREAARVAAANMQAIEAAFRARGLSGRIVAENPPYQLPVGALHVLDVLAEVTERAAIPCVLDLGHLYSFQLCRGLPPLSGLDGFPLERVVELHVAGAEVDDPGGCPVYLDSHGGAEIHPQVLEMLGEVAPRCPQLRAITIEIEEADLERTERQLRQTRAAVSGLLAARPGARG